MTAFHGRRAVWTIRSLGLLAVFVAAVLVGPATAAPDIAIDFEDLAIDPVIVTRALDNDSLDEQRRPPPA
jgi:hypothetical protein